MRRTEIAVRDVRAARRMADSERKQVTAMFVDIVGSMGIAERLGAEEWRDLLDDFFAETSAAVATVDGTVHQFTGDGIMALFGAPVAHEDHARRACLAALEVHARLRRVAERAAADGVDLAVRVGLASGEVIVGEIGNDQQSDFTAIGHTNGLAKRMESLAPIGSTALSAATAALVRGEFELVPLGSFAVKGATGEQQVFELHGRSGAAGGRLEAAREQGALSPLVGRDAEQQVLSAALDQALAGDGQVVALRGDAGVGKSRLVLELIRRCADTGITVHRAKAESFGRELSLLPVLALLRSLIGIGEGDDADTARRHVEAALVQCDAAPDDLPTLLAFLGVPDPSRPAPPADPEALQRQLPDLAGRMVRARAELETVVLVLEDLHWLDDASRPFVAAIAAAAAGSRTLVLATYRPEFAGDELRGEHSRVLEIRPLEGDAVAALLRDLLGTDPELERVAALIANRAAGNPFFCEELVSALRDTGRLKGEPGALVLAGSDDDLVLPPTVLATLAARIDRLAAPSKKLLHDAAVIGLEFSAAMLGELGQVDDTALHPALADLVAAQMLTQLDAMTYAFRHPLIQEVAYHSLLRDRRRATHAALAGIIERRHAHDLDEQAALLAHHAEAAGDTAAAAAWHAQAARWAQRTAPDEGNRHWQASKRLADAVGDDVLRSRLALAARTGILQQAWRVGLDVDEVRALHAEGLALLGEDGAQSPARIALDFGLAAYLSLTGRTLDAHHALLGIHALADALGDPGLQVAAAAGTAQSAFRIGELADAIAFADEGLAVADGDPSVGAGVGMANPYVHCLVMRATCRCLRGDTDAALADLELALDAATAHAAPEMARYAHWARALTRHALGDVDGLRRDAEAARVLAERAGNAWGRSLALQAVAWAHLAAEEWPQAEAAAGTGLGLIAAAGIGDPSAPVLRAALAEALLGMGRPEEAQREASAAAASAVAQDLAWHELVARLALARAATAAGALPEAETALARAGALAARAGITRYKADLNTARTALASALAAAGGATTPTG